MWLTRGCTMNYNQAVRLIAYTDKPRDLQFESICNYGSVILLSRLFKKELETIAEDIIRIRSYSRVLIISERKKMKLTKIVVA
jgi:hypothetical protein